MLKNLIAEAYDHLTGESASSDWGENGDLSSAMMELAKRTMAEADEGARLRLVLQWLAKHGVAINGNADSSAKAFFEIFLRHVSLVDTKNFEPLHAPVWLWRAEASWLTNGTLIGNIGERITRGRFTEELVAGRHFAVMHAPHVSTLATRLAHALALTEEVRTVELPTGAVPTVLAQ